MCDRDFPIYSLEDTSLHSPSPPLLGKWSKVGLSCQVRLGTTGVPYGVKQPKPLKPTVCDTEVHLYGFTGICNTRVVHHGRDDGSGT